MDNDTGYAQDINNLAYHIVTYANRDFLQFNEEFFDNSDLMLKHLAENPELKADWDNLEEMADAIAMLYVVEYKDVMADVWGAMLMMGDLEPKTLN